METRDVITKAKQLRGRIEVDAQSNLLCSITCCKNDDGTILLSDEDRELFADLVREFPTIAEKFILAVEALKESKRQWDVVESDLKAGWNMKQEHWQKGVIGIVGGGKSITDEALAKIRETS